MQVVWTLLINTASSSAFVVVNMLFCGRSVNEKNKYY